VPVTDPKAVKNRVHLDLTSSAADRDQEIDRLLALGRAGSTSARPALNPGLSLPTRRGNEFCVVRPKACLPVRQVLIVYRAGPWSGPAWPGIRTR